MRRLEGIGSEVLGCGVVLGEDRFPKLVLVPPGADQQEIELGAASVQDDKAEVAAEIQPAGIAFAFQEPAGQCTDIGLDGCFASREVVPFQNRGWQYDRLARLDELVPMHIACRGISQCGETGCCHQYCSACSIITLSKRLPSLKSFKCSGQPTPCFR